MIPEEVCNARIRSTFLGFSGGTGPFTAVLQLEVGGPILEFGKLILDRYDGKSAIAGTAFGHEFIIRVVRTVGVDSWEALKGQHLRIVRSGTEVKRIGNIVDNVWFDPKELLKEMTA